MAAGSRVDLAIYPMQRGIGDLFARAAAGIDCAEALQFMQRLFIGRRAPALVDYFLVPMQSAGFQRAQDVVRGAGQAARRIEIFHAQQPAAAVMLGVEVAAQRGDQRAEMQRAGGGGGEAAAIAGPVHVRTAVVALRRPCGGGRRRVP
jgi:hypothetical protein